MVASANVVDFLVLPLPPAPLSRALTFGIRVPLDEGCERSPAHRFASWTESSLRSLLSPPNERI